MGMIEKMLEGMGINPQQLLAASEIVATRLQNIETAQGILNANIVKIYQQQKQTTALCDEILSHLRNFQPDHSERRQEIIDQLALIKGKPEHDRNDNSAGHNNNVWGDEHNLDA